MGGGWGGEVDGSQYSTVTALVLRYSMRASSPVGETDSAAVSNGQLSGGLKHVPSPRSLPKPDCLNPPKGEATSVLL